VRHRGWAKAAGEREDDLNAIAAPVWAAAGEFAAVLGLQGPAMRFDLQRMEAAVPALLDRATTLSRTLGWRRV
jgi:DNA-binding IclR family transcriptional regulator